MQSLQKLLGMKKIDERTFSFTHGFIYWPTDLMSISQRRIKCNIGVSLCVRVVFGNYHMNHYRQSFMNLSEGNHWKFIYN